MKRLSEVTPLVTSFERLNDEIARVGGLRSRALREQDTARLADLSAQKRELELARDRLLRAPKGVAS